LLDEYDTEIRELREVDYSWEKLDSHKNFPIKAIVLAKITKASTHKESLLQGTAGESTKVHYEHTEEGSETKEGESEENLIKEKELGKLVFSVVQSFSILLDKTMYFKHWFFKSNAWEFECTESKTNELPFKVIFSPWSSTYFFNIDTIK
jgi:hypothetical protein